MDKSYHREFLFRKPRPPHFYEEFDGKPGKFSVGINKMPAGSAKGSYSAVVYPNGEFGLGYCAHQKKRKEDRDYDKNVCRGYKVEQVPREHELTTGEKYYDSGDLTPAAIKLDSPLELSQKRKYGLKGITSYGKRIVRNAAYVIEEVLTRPGFYPQFSTLTIPPLPEEMERMICSQWSLIVKKFFQECKRKYRRFGKTFHYVSVTEIQPKRWKTKRDVGLHLHFIYNAFKDIDSKKWVITDSWVRETWSRILTNHLHTHASGGGCESFTISSIMYRREAIRKSAQNYIGKYMSKGGNIVNEVLEEKGEEYLPSQWWSASSYVKYVVKKKTMRCNIEEVTEFILECINENDVGILYAYPALTEVEYVDKYNNPRTSVFLYGYGGKLSRKLHQECKYLWRKLRKLLTKLC